MGKKGAVNVYRCRECGGETVTVNLDDGVTPMFLRCRARPVYAPCDDAAAMCVALTPAEARHLAEELLFEADEAEAHEHLRRAS